MGYKNLFKRFPLKIIITYLFYRILLDCVYVLWVSPIYEYMGFPVKINFINIVISYIVLLVVIIIVPKTNEKISNMIIQLHLIVMIIPITSIYALANTSTKFFFMIMVCFIIQILLLTVLPNIKIIQVKGAKYIFWGIIITLSTFTYTYMLRTYNLNVVALLDFSSIYEIRANKISASGLMMKYLISWQYRIINPLLLIFSYKNKKKSLFIISIGLQVLLYLMIPHKEILFSIFLILIILFVSRKGYRFDSFFVKFISAITILSVIVYKFFGYLMAFGAGPVRLLYVPAIIKFWHYDFFSVNDKLYYSEGIIGTIFGIKYPYSVPSGFLMGRMGNANTGYIAYAYSNAGFLGMILMSMFFVILLKLIDSLTKHEDKMIIFSLLVYPMIILNDGDLSTLLLTGGLFILLILFFIVKDIQITDRNKSSLNKNFNLENKKRTRHC